MQNVGWIGGDDLIRNISDIIEQYIKEILGASRAGMVELQRSELAEQFQCVPSQINYVISTRFSPEHGYIVESKRGGGGYIRIREIQFDETQSVASLLKSLNSRLSEREAEGIIERLRRESIITHRETGMLKSAIKRETLQIPLPERDELRSRLLFGMIVALLQTDGDWDGEA